jgi:hypothetical protein
METMLVDPDFLGLGFDEGGIVISGDFGGHN